MKPWITLMDAAPVLQKIWVFPFAAYAIGSINGKRKATKFHKHPDLPQVINEVIILAEQTKGNGSSVQHDLFNPPSPDPPPQPTPEMNPPMHIRRFILRGAVALASHACIQDLNKWLLTPLSTCGNVKPVEMARDDWKNAKHWMKMLFLTSPVKRVYILFDDPIKQVGMSTMLAHDCTLLKNDPSLHREME